MPPRFSGGVDVSVLGYRVWWRGYLANRTALLSELGQHGDGSQTDEELIAAAYRRWGTALQAHLVGEYAVAIFDRATNSLVLTHDALGVVPLYYSVRGRTVFFGTHLSMLAELVPLADLDDGYLAEFLSHGEYLGEHTIYRGVSRLGVGRTIHYREHRATQLQTWWLGDIPELHYRDPADYDEHFRQLVASAVRTAVDGRTWSELSGGLDSSTIACVAHNLGVRDFATISVVYPSSATADERQWIDIVHAHTGIRGHLVDGDELGPFSVLANRRIEEPSRLHSMWPVFCAYEALLREHDVDVLLSGFGGDQVLFGEVDYPVHAADHLLRFRVPSAVRQVRQWSTTGGDRSLTHRLLATAAVPAWDFLRGHPQRYGRWTTAQRCPWVSRDLLQRTGIGEAAVQVPSPRMPSVRGQAYYERIWRMACAAGQFWGHNTVAAHWRFPLLYRPLVEFMYSLPWQQQVSAGQDRVLQRRSLSGILPEQVRTRRTKSGPDQAVYEGLRTNGEVYELLTARPLIAQYGYVDQGAWRSAVHAAQFGHVRSARMFEAALNLELWLRQQQDRL